MRRPAGRTRRARRARRPLTVDTRCWTDGVRSSRRRRGTRTVPGRQTLPRSLRRTSTIIVFSARSLPERQQLGRQRPVLLARLPAGAGPLDGIGPDPAFRIQGQERLGRRGKDRARPPRGIRPEVEICREPGRLAGAESLERGPRVAIERRVETARQVGLVQLAGGDRVAQALDALRPPGGIHLRPEPRRLAGGRGVARISLSRGGGAAGVGRQGGAAIVVGRRGGEAMAVGRMRGAILDGREAVAQAPAIAVDRPAREPPRPRPAVEGEHPVVEPEPQVGQRAVAGRRRGQALQPAPQVVAEIADQATGERGKVAIGSGVDHPEQHAGVRRGADDGGRAASLHAPQGRPGGLEHVAGIAGVADDGDRVCPDIGPARRAPRPRALEQDQPREVAERQGHLARSASIERGHASEHRGVDHGPSMGFARLEPAARLRPSREVAGARSRARDRPWHVADRTEQRDHRRRGRPGRPRDARPRRWTPVVGRGPVRTGVTVIVPHDGDPFIEPIFAGCHRLNGNGELTGLEWIRESGFLTSPIALTNTHSVGVVRDALIAHAVRSHPPDTELLVAARRRRDLRRLPQRHERLPRPGGASRRGPRSGRRRAGRGRLRRAAGRG